MANGDRSNTPFRLPAYPAEVESALAEVVPRVEAVFPGLPNARWVALRLLQGDQRIEAAVRAGELADYATPPVI